MHDSSSISFSSYSMSLELAMDQQSNLSKILLSNEKKRKDNMRRLCKLCYKDLLRDLAHRINVPESFLMPDRRQCSMCHKEKIKGSTFLANEFLNHDSTKSRVTNERNNKR